jgi:hypothetical protein
MNERRLNGLLLVPVLRVDCYNPQVHSCHECRITAGLMGDLRRRALLDPALHDMGWSIWISLERVESGTSQPALCMSNTHWELLAVSELLRANRLTGEVSLEIKMVSRESENDIVRTGSLQEAQLKSIYKDWHAPTDGNIGALSFDAISELKSRRSAEIPLEH